MNIKNINNAVVREFVDEKIKNVILMKRRERLMGIKIVFYNEKTLVLNAKSNMYSGIRFVELKNQELNNLKNDIFKSISFGIVKIYGGNAHGYEIIVETLKLKCVRKTITFKLRITSRHCQADGWIDFKRC